MIEKAIDHIKNAAASLFSASAELRKSVKDTGAFNKQTLLDEADDAEKFASMLHAHTWGNHLRKIIERAKK